MEIKGFFFDGKTARAVPAEFRIHGSQVRVLTLEGDTLMPICDLSVCDIVPPLGRTRRIIQLPRGQRFETDDQESVREIEADTGLNKTFSLIHLFESRWKTVLVSFIMLLLFVYGFITQGIPLIADQIAHRLPRGVLDRASLEAQTILEEKILNPSALKPEKIQEIQAHFKALVNDLPEDQDSDYSLTLNFGESKVLGANAFALPSGAIFMTDDLVALSESAREIQGILVHEIAHVTQRHAARSIIQNTGLFVLISLLAGDGASITGLAVSIPTLLLESGYSQQFETEADARVADYFMEKGWDIKFFEDILIRLTQNDSELPGQTFVSTHPGIEQRIASLKQRVLYLKRQ